MHPPFVVFALPRSRTAWLSKFLTYQDWFCGHDEARHWRTLKDAEAWLSQPNTGTVETGAAPWWRLLDVYSPEARIVVIRRPVGEVVDSLMRLNLGFDREAMLKGMIRLDAKLAQIERRMKNVLSVRFEDLKNEATSAAVFEHCLPYRHDPAWWRSLADVNVQISMAALVRYAVAFKPQLEKLASLARHAILTEMSVDGASVPEGITFQTEAFDDFMRDGRALFAEHSSQVDEHPASYLSKNIDLMRLLDNNGNMQILTARSNGRMFGYLMSLLSPSLESPDIRTAIHTTFFASKEFPGLGLKLQRAALDGLRKRNIDEVFMRAGPRGSGHRVGSLYKRLGAEEDGQMYRLNLRRA